MHIYLINLARRPDRLAEMDAEISALGLRYTRIDAVDGAASSLGQPENHPISTAAYACYLSHIRAYQAFLKSGDPHCVIMEDDVALSPRLPKALSQLELFTDENAIIRLEAPTNQNFMRPSYCKPKPEFSENGFSTYDLFGKSNGTGAFIISRAMAKIMVSRNATPVLPIDVRLFHPRRANFPGFTILQINPALAIQRRVLNARTDSDIRFGMRPVPPSYPGQYLVRNMWKNLHFVLRNLARPIRLSRSFPFANDKGIPPVGDH